MRFKDHITRTITTELAILAAKNINKFGRWLVRWLLMPQKPPESKKEPPK